MVTTTGTTTSNSGTFNVFTMDLTAGMSGSNLNAHSVEYLASGFKSQGTNVFRAGKDISIVIPQIEGSRNVFDAVLVSLENRANEQTMHSSSSGITISSNPGRAAAGTLGANFGESNSHDTFLNDAYVRGAVDFMHSQVRNQGCLVMDISNSGASYEYVPMGEIHESQSFAIALSGLDISSADAFAYSLGRSLASSAASAGMGIVASQAGLGGFVSTVAASLAGTYVNTNLLPLPRNEQPTNHESRLPRITSNSTVSYERNGDGFQAVNLDFDRTELNAAIDKIKEKIFNEALDRGASPQEVAETTQREVEEIKRDVTEFQKQAKDVVKSAEEAKAEVTASQTINGNASNEETAIQEGVVELVLAQLQGENSPLDRQIMECFNNVILDRAELSSRDQMAAFVPKNKAEAVLKKATLLRYKLEDFVAKHPEAAELCGKIFVGAMYALQGVEYAVAGITGGPFGIATKYASQESTSFFIDRGVEETSSATARNITSNPVLQEELSQTVKLGVYAGLCAGSVKAGKKLVGSLSKNVVRNVRNAATELDANNYLRGLINMGVLSEKRVTRDGHDFFKFNQKCEYNGIKFKKGDYISRDNLHHEWEFFRGSNSHRGAINPLTGKLDIDKAKSDRYLKLP